MEKDVNVVVDNLINYENINKLSWMKVYKDVLKELNLDEKDNNLLNQVIKEITKRGYDIEGEPFSLTKYK